MEAKKLSTPPPPDQPQLPPTPAPTPHRRLEKRQRPQPSTEPKNSRIFVARLSASPFLFDAKYGIGQANQHWLKTGEVDQATYEADLRLRQGTGDKSGLGTIAVDLTLSDGEDVEEPHRPNKRGKTCQEDTGSSEDGWNAEQERALHKAQLRYGEGKEWEKVVRWVNKADPQRRRTIQQCQAQWEVLRPRVLDH